MKTKLLPAAAALTFVLLISGAPAQAVAPIAQNVSKPPSGSLSGLKAQLALQEKSGVRSITLKGDKLYVDLSNGSKETIYVSTSSAITNVQTWASEAGVPYNEDPSELDVRSALLSLASNLLPLLLLIGLGVILYKKFGNKQMGFGKSRARLSRPNQRRVTFKDVAGIDEVKSEVEEIVDFLRSPAKYQSVGGRIPKGVLLIGDPGTGKTLLARAIAGEANVPFFSIAGSDFVEMFVGVGAARVRDLFEQGKKNAPCIIFIDEIDAVGKRRGSHQSGSNDEREQALNALLVEMDGFETSEGVILVAATNRADVLDPALLRPGRFDRRVTVSKPDVSGREQILRLHSKKVPLHTNVILRVLARGIPGASGADLANLVNEAALHAARFNRKLVTAADFDEAKDKHLMGPQRRSVVMNDADKKSTARHEGGHVVCAAKEKDADPIHKATILPRGQALGMMVSLPEGDSYSRKKAQLLAKLVVTMGGRVAEELAYGPDQVSTGAAADIEAATDIAYKMVTQWGMSDLGMRKLVRGDDGSGNNHPMSESLAQKVDEAVQKLIDWAYERATKHLTEEAEALDRVEAGLLEFETLNAEEIRRAMRGELIREPEDAPEEGVVAPVEGTVQPVASEKTRPANA